MTRAQRYYPPITAKTYRLNRYLYELATDTEERQRFLEDRINALESREELMPSEREALRKVDLERILALGGHPIFATVVRRMVDRYERPEEFVYH